MLVLVFLGHAEKLLSSGINMDTKCLVTFLPKG